MKNLHSYIKESAEDGKNGHWQEFADEDTGEIVSMWVPDPDPELEKLKWEIYQQYNKEVEALHKKCLEAEKRNTKELQKFEDELWRYEQELKDANRNYRQLQIDMEEELGQLMSAGKEAEAEEKAQDYGVELEQTADKISELKDKIKKLQPKIDNLNAIHNKIWEPYYKKSDEAHEKWQEWNNLHKYSN